MRPKYIPNNINFRMYSAKAKERYTNSQAFALGQLQSTQTHEFSSTAREILLLKYDKWFKWLIDCEQTLRETKRFDRELREELVYESNRVQREYVEVIKTNPEYFDESFSELWLKTHKSLYDMLKQAIVDYEATSITDLIIYISDVLVKVMDATLYELHEVDNIVYSTNPVFISITDVCFTFLAVLPDRCMLVERLEVYKEARGDFDTIILKQYTEADTFPIYERIADAGYIVSKVL